MTIERSPGWKLFLAGIIGLALVIPLMMVYALVWDRQEQSNVAQNSIAAGWGAAGCGRAGAGYSLHSEQR